MSARGFGDSRPLAAGGSANRRVEIVIYGGAIGSLASWDRAYAIAPR